MISNSSHSGRQPVVRNASLTVTENGVPTNWRAERFTAIFRGTRRRVAFQRAAASHALRKAQAPIGTIRPVSSAMEMKLSGGTMPREGWFQRISASAPTSTPVARSNLGW